jgi:hypothetical protein
MIKNLVRLEVMIGDKIYHLTCDPDSPIESLKEALFQFQRHVGQIEDNIKTHQEKLKAEQEIAKKAADVSEPPLVQ